ncbi:salviol synthase-like [Andrographis paniculata]|uniref:salviol synthase-like n=1 Tax=Andrographis paniculata TaxID=175694 RepID=UPI0021E7BED3|nr:salviol synthase-like [Andrographis paniculata]
MVFLIFASFFFFVVVFLKFSPKSRNLPPGPWKLPLIGNLYNLAGDLPHRALQRLSLKYGPLMHVRLGELSAVVVSSPDAAREVMRTHDVKFASRPRILVAEIMLYDCTSITFSPPGDYWRHLRKICTSELLSAKRVQSFRPLREQVFSDLARWTASGEGSPVNLSEKILSSTYEFTTRAAFGSKTDKKQRFLEILTEAFGYAAGFNIAELFPSIGVVRTLSPARKRMMVLRRELDAILDEIIHQHEESDNDKEDLVDVLLKYRHDSDSGQELALTPDNIKAVILDVLGAGSETSATTIDWAMAEMLKNPIVLEKAQEEVRQVFDEQGGLIDESGIPELKYLKLIIKETLRLHAPVPLLLPRKCDEACELMGYEIPEDTKIIVNTWAINRDPKYWRDPESFKPERFLDSPIDYKGSNFEYTPFGSGRRICPGIVYGLANVETPLAMLLYHFDWKLPDGLKPEEMDMAERAGITASRAKDLVVVPVVKRPLPPVVK